MPKRLQRASNFANEVSGSPACISEDWGTEEEMEDGSLTGFASETIVSSLFTIGFSGTVIVTVDSTDGAKDILVSSVASFTTDDATGSSLYTPKSV